MSYLPLSLSQIQNCSLEEFQTIFPSFCPFKSNVRIGRTWRTPLCVVANSLRLTGEPSFDIDLAIKKTQWLIEQGALVASYSSLSVTPLHLATRNPSSYPLIPMLVLQARKEEKARENSSYSPIFTRWWEGSTPLGTLLNNAPRCGIRALNSDLISLVQGSFESAKNGGYDNLVEEWKKRLRSVFDQTFQSKPFDLHCQWIDQQPPMNSLIVAELFEIKWMSDLMASKLLPMFQTQFEQGPSQGGERHEETERLNKRIQDTFALTFRGKFLEPKDLLETLRKRTDKHNIPPIDRIRGTIERIRGTQAWSRFVRDSQREEGAAIPTFLLPITLPN